MRTKKIILILIIFIAMSFISSTCNASTGSFSVNQSSLSITKGKTATFTINASNCEGQFTITSSDTSVATVSSSSEWVSGTTTITVTGKKEGAATITVTANDVAGTDEEEVTGSKTIKVTVKEATTGSSNTNTSTTVSTDATLSNLGITPYDFSKFKSGTTSYTVNVPYEATSVKIYATATSSKATVTGTGNKTLSVGKNTFKVKVTAEDGKTTKTYTLTINRSETSTVATLKNLGIKPLEYDFSTFKTATTSYNIDVPYEAEKIEIYAETTSSNATVTGTGEQTLNVGENKFDVKVTAQDGKTTKTYTLIINRKAEQEEEPEDPQEDPSQEQPSEVKGLTKLEVAGYTITPEFNANIYEYKLDITDEVSKLDITTEVSSEDYEVEIAGNDNLQQGENVITLLVHNKTDDTTTTYQLIANIGEKDVDVFDINYMIDKAQSNRRKQSLIIIGVIILIVLLIIVYLIERYRISKNEEEELNRFEQDDDTENDFFEKNESKEQFEDFEDVDEEVEKKSNKKGKRFK